MVTFLPYTTPFRVAGNAGDAVEGSQRDLRIDIAQAIGPRALYRQELAGTLAAADRDRHLAPPRQIIAGDAGFIADDVVQRAFGHHLAAMPARYVERRVGKECVRTCRSRWSPVH